MSPKKQTLGDYFHVGGNYQGQGHQQAESPDSEPWRSPPSRATAPTPRTPVLHGAPAVAQHGSAAQTARHSVQSRQNPLQAGTTGP